MNVQPVSNNYSPNFGNLQIVKPQSWDANVLKNLVENESVQYFVKRVHAAGHDIAVSFSDAAGAKIRIYRSAKDNPDGAARIFSTLGDSNSEKLAEKIRNFDNTQILFDGYNANFQKIKFDKEAYLAYKTQKIRNESLKTLDKFNKSLQVVI